MYLVLCYGTFDFIISCIFALCFISLLIVYLKWGQSRIDTHVEKIPGNLRLPIIGTAYILFFVKRRDFFKFMINRFKKYPGIFRSWLGSTPSVNIGKAEYAEVVLNNSIQIDKSSEYDYIRPWLGEGLLLSSGKRWQIHRKLLTPAFHFKILDNSLKTFELKAQVLIGQLKNIPEGKIINIYPYITRCALDIICETAMGVQLNSMTNKNNHGDYVNAIYTVTDISSQRILKPWLQPNFIFKHTNRGKRFKSSLEVLHDFTTKVIRRRRRVLNELNANVNQDKTTPSNMDTFLDILLQTAATRHVFNESDIRQEVDTFLFEGHDTVAAAVCWCLFLLGNHLDIQDRVYEEIKEIFEGCTGNIDMEMLGRLKLLERCIKEALRLYPSVPIVARQLQRDIDIGGYLVPAGCAVNLHIYAIHRDSRHYEDPEKFDPDRFLPENSEGRPAYAYIPFSGGPRNCIGRKYAILEQKVLLAHILRDFKVKAAESVKTVQPAMDLILRPADGLLMSLCQRK